MELTNKMLHSVRINVTNLVCFLVYDTRFLSVHTTQHFSLHLCSLMLMMYMEVIINYFVFSRDDGCYSCSVLLWLSFLRLYFACRLRNDFLCCLNYLFLLLCSLLITVPLMSLSPGPSSHNYGQTPPPPKRQWAMCDFRVKKV